eukprot:3106487-Pyramimonas_sp.AAC.1
MWDGHASIRSHAMYSARNTSNPASDTYQDARGCNLVYPTAVPYDNVWAASRSARAVMAGGSSQCRCPLGTCIRCVS